MTPKKSCPYCQLEVSANNFSRHLGICKARNDDTAQTKKACPHCQYQVSRANLSRHLGTCKVRNTASLPIATCDSIFDVLSYCDIQDFGWSLGLLDGLRNFRLEPPHVQAVHTPWLLQADHPVKRALPSLERFLVGLTSSPDILLESSQFYNKTQQIALDQESFPAWVADILEGQESLVRALNVPVEGIIQSKAYLDASKDIAGRMFSGGSIKRIDDAEANVTPRSTLTEVHHDTDPHVSIAIGTYASNEPLKLWLLWPSTELHHLASCYGDTNLALKNMEHGSFLVQMPGDIIAVPPNSPHAVLALNSCYLYGHTFSTTAVHDPSSAQVDVLAKISPDVACKKYIKHFAAGLDDQRFRDRYIGSLKSTWAVDSEIFRDCNNAKGLARVWANDIVMRGSCSWCFHYRSVNLSDSLEHVGKHLGLLPSSDKLKKRSRGAYIS